MSVFIGNRMKFRKPLVRNEHTLLRTISLIVLKVGLCKRAFAYNEGLDTPWHNSTCNIQYIV